MVEHTKTIRRQFADELFDCVWPFCGIGAYRDNLKKTLGANLFHVTCLFLYPLKTFGTILLINRPSEPPLNRFEWNLEWRKLIRFCMFGASIFAHGIRKSKNTPKMHIFNLGNLLAIITPPKDPKTALNTVHEWKASWL